MKESSSDDSDEDDEILDIKKDRRVNRFQRRIVRAQANVGYSII